MGHDSNVFLVTGTVEQQSAVSEVLDLIVKLYLLTPVYSGTQRTVLANARSRSLYAIAHPSVVCLSVVCNVRAPYSGGSNFRQYFYGIRYLGHQLTSTENFTEIVPGEPLRWGS